MRRGAHARGRIPSLALLLAALLLGLSACGTAEPAQAEAEAPAQEAIQSAAQDGAVTQGTETYRGFQMDNVLHHPRRGHPLPPPPPGRGTMGPSPAPSL